MADRLLRQDAIARLAAVGLPATSSGILDSKIFQDAMRAQETFERFAQPYGGVAEMFRKVSAQQEMMAQTLRTSELLAGLNVARNAQWASVLAKAQLPDVAALYPNVSAVITEATKLHELARSSLSRDVLEMLSGIKRGLELPDQLKGLLANTTLKMSVLAGVEYTSGIDTRLFQEAYSGLLGDWHTTPQLPETFWVDPSVREDHYREAQVDPLRAASVTLRAGVAALGSLCAKRYPGRRAAALPSWAAPRRWGR